MSSKPRRLSDKQVADNILGDLANGWAMAQRIDQWEHEVLAGFYVDADAAEEDMYGLVFDVAAGSTQKSRGGRRPARTLPAIPDSERIFTGDSLLGATWAFIEYLRSKRIGR